MVIKFSLFWDITQRSVVFFFTDVRGQRIRRIFKSQESEKIGQIDCPETSVNNYHTTPPNIPEEADLKYVTVSTRELGYTHGYNWYGKNAELYGTKGNGTMSLISVPYGERIVRDCLHAAIVRIRSLVYWTLCLSWNVGY
jgi:hypothetical protein